jgi:hypothetical protein
MRAGAFIRLMRQSVSVKHREQRYHRQEDEEFGADLVKFPTGHGVIP